MRLQSPGSENDIYRSILKTAVLPKEKKINKVPMLRLMCNINQN